VDEKKDFNREADVVLVIKEEAVPIPHYPYFIAGFMFGAVMNFILWVILK